jgi:hypothetical protein|tara:strand:- start:534 stop:968 length:435 start_codon:yes stop_codon:yes gene_type:complete
MANWMERPDEFLGKEVTLEVGGARPESSANLVKKDGFSVFRLNDRYTPWKADRMEIGELLDSGSEAYFSRYEVTDIVYVSDEKIEWFVNAYVADERTDANLVKVVSGPNHPFIEEQKMNYHWRTSKALKCILWRLGDEYVHIVR